MSQEKFTAATEAEEANQLELAKHLYQECLTQDPSHGSIWLRYMGLLQKQGRHSEVMEAGERALSCELSGSRRALAHNTIGRSYLQLENFQAAEQQLRRSLELNPDPGACVLLYMSLLRQEREGEGVAFLHEAIRLDDTYEEAHYNLGCHYKRKRQDKEAEASFRRAIELAPDYGRAFTELGLIISKKGEAHFAEARQLLARAVSLEPTYGWARTYYANLLWKCRELDAAEEQYRRGIEHYPTESFAYWSYGQFLSDTDQDESKAESLLHKALELDPKDPQAHKMLGRHFLRYGHLDKAREALEVAVALGGEGALKYLKLAKKYQ